MEDILYNCAVNYDDISKYNYTFVLGDSKNKITINLNMKCAIDEFTHVIGLEHLKDIEGLQTHKISRKLQFFQNILERNITMSDINSSIYIDKPNEGTYNDITQRGYTIRERITALQNIGDILDNAYKGKFYKWDKNVCKVQLPNKKWKQSHINADYMLCISELFPNNKNQKIYFFMFYEDSEVRRKNNIRLRVHSAFIDCLDLTVRQKRYAILKECKYRDGNTENIQQIYVSPNYK